MIVGAYASTGPLTALERPISIGAFDWILDISEY